MVAPPLVSKVGRIYDLPTYYGLGFMASLMAVIAYQLCFILLPMASLIWVCLWLYLYTMGNY